MEQGSTSTVKRRREDLVFWNPTGLVFRGILLPGRRIPVLCSLQIEKKKEKRKKKERGTGRESPPWEEDSSKNQTSPDLSIRNAKKKIIFVTASFQRDGGKRRW